MARLQVTARVGFVAAAAVLGLVAAPLRAQGPTLLRLKPTAGEGRLFRLLKTDKVVKEDWQGAVRTWTYEFDKRLRESVALAEDGTLARTVSQLGGRMKYNGVAVDEAAENPTRTEVVTVRGEEVGAGEDGTEIEPVRMRLVLPQGPVAPGDTWSFTAPPSYRFPAPLRTDFVVAGIKDYRGRPCVYIKSRTAYEGTHADRNVKVEVASRGRIFLDAAAGCVVNAVSVTRFDMTYLKDPGDGTPRRVTKNVDIRYAELP